MGKTATLIATFLLVVSGCYDSEATSAHDFVGTIREVRVAVDAGDVILQPSSASTAARVETSLTCRTVVPPVEVYLEGETLHVTMVAGHGASACTGHYSVWVPAAAAAEVTTGSGTVVAEGLTGDVAITSFDGDVVLSGLAGDVEVTAVSGAVTATALAGATGSVVTGAGEVTLCYHAAPTRLEVETVIGDVALTVPVATYRIEAEVEAGQVDISGVTDQPTAANGIRARSERGNIAIRAAAAIAAHPSR